MNGQIFSQNEKELMDQINNFQDKKRALDILEGAFNNSPGMLWMLPHKDRKSLRRFLYFFLKTAIVNHGGWITRNKHGVVLFYRLQHQKRSWSLFFTKLGILLFVMGFKNGLRAARYKKLVDGIRPATGWFGWLVATDQNVVGNAAGYEIKQEMFRMADETNEPIFVETTVSRVKYLYECSGYYVYNSIHHPYEELTVWFMRRDPHTKVV
jgi:hypothetical protein